MLEDVLMIGGALEKAEQELHSVTTGFECSDLSSFVENDFPFLVN